MSFLLEIPYRTVTVASGLDHTAERRGVTEYAGFGTGYPMNMTTGYTTTTSILSEIPVLTQNGSGNSSSFPVCVNKCVGKDVRISSVIIALSVLAMVENLVLISAVTSLKLTNKCKMLAFLWHFTFADIMISFQFLIYHGRSVSVCPLMYSCNPSFLWEWLFIQTIFISSLLASYFFVLAATIDRFIAVKWSLRYVTVVTTRRVRVTAGFIWAISVAIALAGVFAMLFWDLNEGHSFLTISVAILCVFAAGGVIVLNLAVVGYAWLSVNRGMNIKISRRASIYQSESTISTVSGTPPSPKFRKKLSTIQLTESQKQNRKLALTLFLFGASFLVSCVPWPLTLLICKNPSMCRIKYSDEYILVLVLVHALIIPIIYGFRIEEVKRKVKRLFTTCYFLKK